MPISAISRSGGCGTTRPTSLLALMDAKKIDKAVVSSAAAITYRNAQAGNEEVAEEVKAPPRPADPFAVINPFYAGWQDDLKICHEEFGMKGLRLYPKWHNYSLSDPCCLELVDAATERGMVISIPIRVEDNRAAELAAERARHAAGRDRRAGEGPSRRHGSSCSTASATPGRPLGRKNNGLPANYAIEISRLSAVLANEIGQLIANLGADRLVFGTGMPFNYPDPALVKLEVLDASEPDKEKIRSQNAASWLRL